MNVGIGRTSYLRVSSCDNDCVSQRNQSDFKMVCYDGFFYVNLFQSDFISMGNTENHFSAASSRVVCINAVRLCIQF